MTLLSQFAKILVCIEKAQAFVHFLQQPIGIAAISALLFYGAFQQLGYDSLSATILACTVGLSTLYAALTDSN
ncbi:MAG: hypothetical protein AAGC93_24340 [Cyanobacteria bacterium P01_F01_bin.53]